MNEEYESFVNDELPEINYDCKRLQDSHFRLICRCNKNNPDCQKKINNEKEKGYDIEIVELDRKDMVDVWRRVKLEKLD